MFLVYVKGIDFVDLKIEGKEYLVYKMKLFLFFFGFK